MTTLTIQGTFSIIGYAVGLAGVALTVFSRVKNENLKDLKDRVDILEKEREQARSQHLESQKAISALEGKLEAYKEIPLKFIPEALAQLIKSNALILESLQKSALIAEGDAHDGGLLVQTEQPLKVKNVE